MTEYPNKMQFGWEGDNGLGDQLIEKIMAGKKTATCAPIFDFTQEELEQTFASKGKIVTIIDKHNNPRCTVEMIDVFETTFGNPDQRLLIGEGFANDPLKFQSVHRNAWANWLEENNHELKDDTILIVEHFRLVKS